jgi:predicted TIM-barrel fold metal-dependent hydrolase
MDNAGISYIIVSISAPGIQGVPNMTAAIAVSKGINDEIFEKYVKPHPSRFGFFATVPLKNATAAALDFDRAVIVIGAKGAMIAGYTEVANADTGAVDIVYLDDPRCRPFWLKVNQLGVPIYIHPRAPPVSQQLMFNHADNTHSKYPGLVTAGWEFTADAAVHSLRLMLSGLFDEYPSVQII